MIKKLLIAASLLASTSAFAASYTSSFNNLIDPLAAANYGNTINYASVDINSTGLTAGTLFDLSGDFSIFTIAGEQPRNLVDVSLFLGSVQDSGFSVTNNSGNYQFQAQDLIAGNTYQLRFQLAAGSYKGNGVNKILVSTINGGYNVSPVVTVSTPVPEPETYGMMFMGLALMGTIAFRRQKNS